MSNLTQEELDIEWRYRYLERLALLCGTDDPTEEQEEIARKEADDVIRALS